MPRSLQGERYFRWRGGDVSRVEGLSDAVFAFALTLLVVSLQVPRTYDELAIVIRQFPAFAACFALLVWIWYLHYKFHRRFGLENALMVFINAVLLFVVLFYVYPLKFVATLVINDIMGLPSGVVLPNGAVKPVLRREDWQPLMLFYSGGFVGIFLLFTLMNAYAYRRRDDLGLDAVERLMTRTEIRTHLLSMGVGVLSLVLALAPGRWKMLSGMVFFLLGPVHYINGYLSGRAVERLAAREA